MLGVLIASANPAIRRSLAAMLDGTVAVYEVTSVGEALSRAGTERMDAVFLDDEFEDGNAEHLAARLADLQYGYEIVPLLPSAEERYLRRFRPYGVRFSLTKPFNVSRVREVLAQIEALTTALNLPPDGQEAGTPAPANQAPPAVAPAETVPTSASRDTIREVSYRFRRLLSRSLDRDGLVCTFIEAVQEQFETDHVVLLLPASDAPCYRVVSGARPDESPTAYGLSMGDPLLAYVFRRGRPVSLADTAGMDAQQRLKAHRISERLGIRYLCPVQTGGRPMGLVGVGVLDPADCRADYATLRLFVSFFAKALENAELHRRVSAAESTYHGVFERLPVGAVAVCADGKVQAINQEAACLLGVDADDVLDQPIEKLGSKVADIVRGALVDGEPAACRWIHGASGELVATAGPLGENADAGVTLTVCRQGPPVENECAKATQPDSWELLDGLARVLAQNFKNALVPIQTCAELLPERYEQQDFRDFFFSAISENAGNIDRWINRLLGFCEMSAASETRQSIALTEIVEEAVKDIAVPEDSPVEVEMDVAPDLGVKGNVTALVQAVAEVVSNAVEAMRAADDPQLTLRARLDGAATVRLVVEDNGPGIPEGEIARCCAPFQTSKPNGLGLGLAFVERIVRQHNGTFNLSGAETGGVRAVLSLPAAPVPDPVL